MPNRYSTFAKQSRLRIKSTLRLALYLAALGCADLLLFHNRWHVPVFLVLAAFFVLVAGVEIIAALKNERQAAARTAPRNERIPPSSDFSYIATPDGEWYQRTVIVGGRPVKIRIVSKAARQAVLHAARLANNPDQLETNFVSFKHQEATRFPSFREEIYGLQIDSIDFVSVTHPDIAEVSFTSESGGEPWTCVCEAGTFRHLEQES